MKPLLSYSLLLTLVAFYSLSVSEVEAQACTFPTFGDVSFVIDDALDNIAGTNTTSVLFDYALSCISVAREMDRFRLATAVINFTTNSTVLRSIGCQRNTFCLTFLEMSCNERTNMWERNQIFVTQSFTKDGNESLNVSLRMDCGNCGIQRSIPKEANPVFDPKTHCFRCNSLCLIEGFRQCFGLTVDNCCNYYQNGRCIDECGDRRITVSDTNFTCICNNSFSGPNCDVCNLNCGPNGILINQYCMCECNDGFSGTTCGININECEGVECRNGGTCIDLVNDFICRCPRGYDGRLCQNNIDDCLEANCNSGTCIDGLNSFTCICNPGFTGEFCNVTIDNCADNPCLNGGVCVNRLNNFTCNCTGNFTGRRCRECSLPYVLSNERCILPCDAFSPCQNNGTCINRNNGSYTCQCTPGFNGPNCTATKCPPGSCLNNGTCSEILGNIVCTCQPNFTGKRCEICIIKNCQTCSTRRPNVCVTCNSGYVPAVNSTTGGCAIDLPNKCPSSIVTNVPLCQWKEVTSACCYADICDKESSGRNVYSGYKRDRKCYESYHSNWRRRANAAGVSFARTIGGGSSQRHKNERERLIGQWRDDLEDALLSLQGWVPYLRRKVPGIVVSPPPFLDTVNGDPFTLYNQYIQYWSGLVSQFNNEVIPLCNQ